LKPNLNKFGTKLDKNNKYKDKIEYRTLTDTWYATKLTHGHLKKIKKITKIKK